MKEQPLFPGQMIVIELLLIISTSGLTAGVSQIWSWLQSAQWWTRGWGLPSAEGQKQVRGSNSPQGVAQAAMCQGERTTDAGGRHQSLTESIRNGAWASDILVYQTQGQGYMNMCCRAAAVHWIFVLVDKWQTSQPPKLRMSWRKSVLLSWTLPSNPSTNSCGFTFKTHNPTTSWQVQRPPAKSLKPLASSFSSSSISQCWFQSRLIHLVTHIPANHFFLFSLILISIYLSGCAGS